MLGYVVYLCKHRGTVFVQHFSHQEHTHYEYYQKKKVWPVVFIEYSSNQAVARTILECFSFIAIRISALAQGRIVGLLFRNLPSDNKIHISLVAITHRHTQILIVPHKSRIWILCREIFIEYPLDCSYRFRMVV